MTSGDRTKTAFSWFVAALFVVAIITKLGAMGQFQDSIVASRLVPRVAATWVARGLILTECALAACLVMPRSRYAALTASGLLFGTFAGYHLWVLEQAIRPPCSCFGTLFKIPPPVGLGACALLCVASLRASIPLINETKLHAKTTD